MARIFQRRGRDRLGIVAQILGIAEESGVILKTQIMYRANLSFAQLTDYLKFLLRNDLLESVMLNGKEAYIPTEKGIDFLQRYREITELLREDYEEHEGKLTHEAKFHRKTR